MEREDIFIHQLASFHKFLEGMNEAECFVLMASIMERLEEIHDAELVRKFSHEN
jgi:hypothetical protein